MVWDGSLLYFVNLHLRCGGACKDYALLKPTLFVESPHHDKDYEGFTHVTKPAKYLHKKRKVAKKHLTKVLRSMSVVPRTFGPDLTTRLADKVICKDPPCTPQNDKRRLKMMTRSLRKQSDGVRVQVGL
eukprot:203289-Amphidinium_carterae.1